LLLWTPWSRWATAAPCSCVLNHPCVAVVDFDAAASNEIDQGSPGFHPTGVELPHTLPLPRLSLQFVSFFSRSSFSSCCILPI
jgi:hypothetical protein